MALPILVPIEPETKILPTVRPDVASASLSNTVMAAALASTLFLATLPGAREFSATLPNTQIAAEISEGLLSNGHGGAGDLQFDLRRAQNFMFALTFGMI